MDLGLQKWGERYLEPVALWFGCSFPDRIVEVGCSLCHSPTESVFPLLIHVKTQPFSIQDVPPSFQSAELPPLTAKQTFTTKTSEAQIRFIEGARPRVHPPAEVHPKACEVKLMDGASRAFSEPGSTSYHRFSCATAGCSKHSAVVRHCTEVHLY